MQRLIICFLLLITLFVGSALGSDCKIPLSDPTESMDWFYTAQWCGSPIASEHFWNIYNGLHLDKEAIQWAKQMNLDGSPCNPLGLSNRLFNSAQSLLATMYYRDNSTLDQHPYDWWEFVTSRSEDSYVISCDNSRLATNYNIPVLDIYYTALRPAFFNKAAPFRGSTLVHEAAHEDTPHFSHILMEALLGTSVLPDNCGSSWDTYFGDPEHLAQTWGITYMYYAMDSFLKNPDNEELYIALYRDNMCGFLPAVNEYSYNEMKGIIESKIDYCLVITPDHPERHWLKDFFGIGGDLNAILAGYPPDPVNYLDHVHKWPCACDVNRYMPGGEEFCDETNPLNIDVNMRNQAGCEDLNELIATGELTPGEINAAWYAFNGQSACINYINEEDIEEYCSENIADPTLMDVDDLEKAWEDDGINNFLLPNYAFKNCAGQFCEDRFDAAWVSGARNACYEWNDGLGCLDTLCGPLDGFAPESIEYFESLQCRRHYVEHNGDTEAYFDTLESLGTCENVYTRCVNRKGLDDWLEARQNGDCSLLTSLTSLLDDAETVLMSEPEIDLPYDTSSSRYQIHAISYLRSIDYDITYSQFQAECPSCELKDCEMRYELCETVRELATQLAAEFVEVSEIPEKVLLMKTLPDPPWVNARIKDLDFSMVNLAALIADPDSNISENTYKEAVKHLSRMPENLHAVSKFFGRNSFFALYGTEGMDRMFGEESVAVSQSSDFQFDFELNAEQQQLLPELIAQKETRERVESALIQDVIQLIADADPELLFNFMTYSYQADNADEVNMVLDSMLSILQ